MSPTFVSASHGELFEAILVRTSLDWWRAILLKVRVGQFSSVSMILPYGTRPSLISAWKPLQIPAMRPSLFSRSSVTASLISSFLKKAVMNLPEPSGSSPPENPPGMKIIWLSLTFAAKSAIDAATSAAVRLFITKISGSAPALINALAVSYSQLVPGKAGMSTFGAAHFTAAANFLSLS